MAIFNSFLYVYQRVEWEFEWEFDSNFMEL